MTYLKLQSCPRKWWFRRPSNTMTDTPFDPVPIARSFYRLFCHDLLEEAKALLVTKTENEEQRIAVIVTALEQSASSFVFAVWLKMWATSPLPRTAAITYRDAQGMIREERRGFREGPAFRVSDPVRIDGHSYGRISFIPEFGNSLQVLLDGAKVAILVRRHQVTLLT